MVNKAASLNKHKHPDCITYLDGYGLEESTDNSSPLHDTLLWASTGHANIVLWFNSSCFQLYRVDERIRVWRKPHESVDSPCHQKSSGLPPECCIGN
ncbi:hypothetical protein AVEN_92280-1 [Araneus ventricosus]|uniref:Uncharacterized protein n=1 Tax=Araneus ventricosus TaxID=182803 RepID=A0A4Y2AKJ7_ARAVE|nr:hypothetical protein AVEN_92280-1 [Araneus ventricosus]